MLLGNFYLEIFFDTILLPSLDWRNPESLQSSLSQAVNGPYQLQSVLLLYKIAWSSLKKKGERIAYPAWKCLYLTCLRDNIAIMKEKKKREKEKKKKTDKTKYYNSIAFYCQRLVHHWCSCHILKSCVIYYWTDTWQNGIQRKMFSPCHEHGTKKRFWVSTKNDIHNVLVHHRIVMAQW